MLTVLMRILLFISSYAPLYLLLLIENWNRSFFALLMVVLILLTVFILILFLKITKSCSSCISLNFETIKPKKDSYFGYLITCAIPLLTLDIMNNASVIMNLTLFLMIGYIYVINDLVHLNPVLNMIGYRLYESDFGLIITKLTLDQIKYDTLLGNKFRASEIGRNRNILIRRIK